MRTRVGRAMAVLGLLLVVVTAGQIGVGSLSPGAATAGAPEPGPSGSYQLYYVVAASHEGRPENLWLIASRLLGDADRATEIFDLNAGRPQPTGGALVDPSVLRPGWELLLPWDAVGDGVRYGHLSPVGPPSTPTPRPSGDPSGGQPTPRPPAADPNAGQPGAGSPPRSPGAGSSPSASPGPSASLSPTPSVAAAPTRPAGGGVASGALPWSTSGCQASLADWGQPWPALDEAWSRSRGSGVTVAVVDSGVDATLPELTGRVTAGADIVTGAGRAGTDCLGTGTAIAGIVAADASAGARSGVAPEASVLPIRLVDTTPQARLVDQVTAIEVALSTGARVLVLGNYLDLSDPQVNQAIAASAEHDVVVVVPARLDAAAESVPGPPGSVLRVGAVDEQGRPVAEYPVGEVDVVAASVTGADPAAATMYATAYVAGVAALIRAADPDLSAEQVVQQVSETSRLSSTAGRDDVLGWGSVDPVAAVSTVSGASAGREASEGDRDGDSAGWPLAVASVVLVILGALFWARRKLAADASADATADEPADATVQPDDGAVSFTSDTGWRDDDRTLPGAETDGVGAGVSPGPGRPGAFAGPTSGMPAERSAVAERPSAPGAVAEK
ncbi:S8 family serine peptidase [Solwaraspora sp. WMMD406]|uniref:S8 family serine peptidase n=1 Tax=Solwaraspora sp. WMMD406 TaxID=3016095 RepID=UPI00241759DF|nr:S8 family serine peptidase [Solwaraspora sp. WMMD406]MDG4765998.1 S8 family serine peptidase [Solwaraspora sp. WMMD406]